MHNPGSMKPGSKHLDAKNRLIFALDVGSSEEAEALVDELKDIIGFFKVGLQLFVATGLEVIQKLIDRKLDVFLDLKMNDVPHTVRSSVREVARLGVRFLTVYGSGVTAEAAAAGKRNTNLKILSVTLLTSLDEQDLGDLLMVGHKSKFTSLEDYIIWRAEQTLSHGCDGWIASGQNAKMLRQRFGDQPILVCPGIRPAADSLNDHKRAVTPYEAIVNGADYLVVGRPIKNAGNRVRKAEEIIEEIDSALQDLETPGE